MTTDKRPEGHSDEDGPPTKREAHCFKRRPGHASNRAPRVLRVHPNDYELIAPRCEGDPPTINGSAVDIPDEVEEGSPEGPDDPEGSFAPVQLAGCLRETSWRTAVSTWSVSQ